jgi:hypothetical protein
VTRRVVIACQVHRAYRPGFHSPATSATEITGVRPVSIITRINSQAEDRSLQVKQNVWFMRFTCHTHKSRINRWFCHMCKQYREVGHICFMKPLQNKPAPTDKVLYVFYDFEKRRKIPNISKRLRSMSQIWSVYNSSVQNTRVMMTDQDCSQCGRRKHSFWHDSVGELLSYLCEQRQWSTRS